MFTITTVNCICEGDLINYSTEIVRVLSVKKSVDFVVVVMSNNVCRCYAKGKLIKRYDGLQGASNE